MDGHPGIHLARDFDTRRSSLSRWLRAGRIVRFHAGVYVDADLRHDVPTLLAATQAAFPTGVLLADAALFIAAGWRDLRVLPIEVATTHHTANSAFYHAHHRRVPADWRAHVQGFTVCRPAFAAADLAGRDEGGAIDRFLREGGDLADVEAAAEVIRYWPGAERRRAVIRASRTRPWSAAERRLHRVLLDAGLTGWQANVAVRIGAATYILDVAFRSLKIALEADGYETHGTNAAFVRDRERQNHLVLAGWTVLRFSWAQLLDPERVVSEVRAAIRTAKARKTG